MGILNLTPDSFYDGGLYRDEKSVLDRVESMLEEGAMFIDMGAYSSRPGASDISVQEEKERLLPLLELVLQEFPDALVSVDTFRSEVAAAALDRGAAMINDISGGHLDDAMLPTVARHKAPYIAMHMRGNPQTMMAKTEYEDLLLEIQAYFSERTTKATAHGINDLILDPGFGFAKTVEQNFFLLKHLDLLQFQQRPILVGLSRKSMIYKTLRSDPGRALNGTTSLNTVALLNGANILRVHDVREAMEVVKLVAALREPKE